MKKYVLYCSETYAYESEIKTGICREHLEECEDIAEFETKEQALKELEGWTSMILPNYTEGKKIKVVEYFIDEEFDEEGDIISGETIAYSDGLE